MARRSTTSCGVYASRKGKSAMNKVCRYLGEVFEGQSFMRNLKTLSGDMFTSVEFPYVVEVKNVESWRYSHFLNTDGTIKCTIRRFWKQVIRDTNLANRKLAAKNNLSKKRPWLIFTKNNEPYYCCFRTCDLAEWPETYVEIGGPGLMIFVMPPPEQMRIILGL